MAGDEARCCPAFGARGAVATAAEASPAADVVMTASGARGETTTTSEGRDVAAELPPSAGKKLRCSSAPGLVAKTSGARGAVPTAAAACPVADLVTTVSGACGAAGTTFRGRGGAAT